MENYKKVITDDNSITYYNSQYDENYHSIFGAISESINKFIIPSKLIERVKKGIVNILDIPFGLGYNSLCTLNYEGDINITAIEKDIKACFLLLKDTKSIPFEWVEALLSLKKSNYYNKNNKSIKLVIDDARNYLKNETKKNYDFIFLDPFSPLKNPELWTLDFFRILYGLLNDDGLILTYSSALPVRAGFIKAGFFIGETPAFGRNRGGTICAKQSNLILDNISDTDNYLLKHSTGKIPYRDKKLISQKNEIILNREKISKRTVSLGLLKTIKKCHKELKHSE